MRKQKFALVLSGGGFRGAFQLGALNYLKKNWHLIDATAKPMKFDLISGVSAGALNGVMIAMDKIVELNELWEKVAQNGVSEIYTSDFIDTNSEDGRAQLVVSADGLKKHFLPKFDVSIGLFKGIGLLFSKAKKEAFFNQVMEKAAKEIKNNLSNFKSVADNTPLKDKLTRLVDKNAIHETKYFCGFVSLDDGKYASVMHKDFTTDEDFVNGILASTAVPLVWKPVEEIASVQGKVKNAVDGGIRNSSPLGDVIDQINQDPDDAEYTIIVINCHNGSVEKSDFDQANAIQIALRSLQDIALSEIFINDITQFMQVNSILEQVEEQGANVDLVKYDHKEKKRTNIPLKKFKIVLIEPAKGVLGDFLLANESIINKRIKHGEQKAEEALQNFLPDSGSIERELRA